MNLKSRRDIDGRNYFAIYYDENYEYSVTCSDGIVSVSAKPFDPYRPYINITNDSPASLSFFGDVIGEEALDKYVKYLNEAPATIRDMRKLVEQA